LLHTKAHNAIKLPQEQWWK